MGCDYARLFSAEGGKIKTSAVCVSSENTSSGGCRRLPRENVCTCVCVSMHLRCLSHASELCRLCAFFFFFLPEQRCAQQERRGRKEDERRGPIQALKI